MLSFIRCGRFQEEVRRYAGGVYGEFRDYEIPGDPDRPETYHCGVDLKNRFNGTRGQVATDGRYGYALIPMEKDIYSEWKRNMERCGCKVVDPHVYYAYTPMTHQIFLTHTRCEVRRGWSCAVRKVLP